MAEWFNAPDSSFVLQMGQETIVLHEGRDVSELVATTAATTVARGVTSYTSMLDDVAIQL